MKRTVLILACLLLAAPCQARTIYVDANATGVNNGTSWANAYNDLQDSFADGEVGDEILAAEGSYKPEQGIRITPDDFNGDDRANFAINSENGEHIVTGSETVTTTEMIYWTTVFGRSIKRSNLESPEIEVVLSGVNVTNGIALDMIDGRVYWAGVQPQGTYRANLDGTDMELLFGAALKNIALDLVAGKIYWTETGVFYKICRANLDGTDIEDLITTEILRRPNGIALDLAGGKIYWGEGVESQEEKGKIRRANLDGSGIEDLIEVGWNTFGLELDLGEGKMYWTNNHEGEVWRANLDGTKKELLIAGLDNPLGLALDLTKGKLYCAEHHAGKIKRANLDGTEVEDFLVTDRFRVEGLALTIIPEVIVEVAVDIKPQSCPNPFNVNSKGVLPVAILGTEEFDVSTIVPTSVRLAGVEPIRDSLEDVAAPLVDPNECECSTNGPDGFTDLTLKFETQAVLEALGEVNTGDILTLRLTGVLNDETSIEGADCVVIVGRFKPINKADINKDGFVNAVDIAIVAENWLNSSIVEE